MPQQSCWVQELSKLSLAGLLILQVVALPESPECAIARRLVDLFSADAGTVDVVDLPKVFVRGIALLLLVSKVLR